MSSCDVIDAGASGSVLFGVPRVPLCNSRNQFERGSERERLRWKCYRIRRFGVCISRRTMGRPSRYGYLRSRLRWFRRWSRFESPTGALAAHGKCRHLSVLGGIELSTADTGATQGSVSCRCSRISDLSQYPAGPEAGGIRLCNQSPSRGSRIAFEGADEGRQRNPVSLGPSQSHVVFVGCPLGEGADRPNPDPILRSKPPLRR